MGTHSNELDRLTQRWERFRQGRNIALAIPHGWLSLTSFQWLPPVPSPLEGVPGLWSFEGTTAFLTATAQDHLTLVESGETVVGTVSARLADEESIMWVESGSVVVELGMRANRFMIRTRDSLSPTLRDFTAVPVFDYNPAFVVHGRFEPYAEPRVEVIKTAHPQIPGLVTLVGEVVFDHAGTTHRLAAAQGPLGSLVVTFADATDSTGAHWRKLEVNRPQPDHSVVLDFNRAINYPSAFTDFGSCPAPSSTNTLPISIEAGERQLR